MHGGSSDINMASDFTGIDIESTRKGLPLKKKELDSKLNVDRQKPPIESMTILQIRET